MVFLSSYDGEVPDRALRSCKPAQASYESPGALSNMECKRLSRTRRLSGVPPNLAAPLQHHLGKVRRQHEQASGEVRETAGTDHGARIANSEGERIGYSRSSM